MAMKFTTHIVHTIVTDIFKYVFPIKRLFMSNSLRTALTIFRYLIIIYVLRTNYSVYGRKILCSLDLEDK